MSQIVAATMEDLGMKLPKPTVDLEAIRKQYHQAAAGERGIKDSSASHEDRKKFSDKGKDKKTGKKKHKKGKKH